MEEFSINGNGDFLKISLDGGDELLGNPSQGGYYVTCTVEVKSGNFSVKSKLLISTGEIYEFYKKLKLKNEQLNGMVKFETYEMDFDLTLEYDLSGHVKVKGSFAEDYIFRNELKFEFRTDQSYINSTLSELKIIVDKYGDWNGKRN